MTRRRWLVGAAVVLVFGALALVRGTASGEVSPVGAAFCESYPHTSASTASVSGVFACLGPGYTGSIGYRGRVTGPSIPTARGGSWQCTEYASRYFDVETGGSAPANSTGADWVERTHRAYPQFPLQGGKGTGRFAKSIVPGVIISMWGGPTSDPLGHVAVVAAVNVTRGNGSITVVEENLAGFSTIQVVDGSMTYGSLSAANNRFYTTFQWLTGLPRPDGGPPSANGSLIRTPDGSVYVIAGDAPLRLGTCAHLAEAVCSKVIDVDSLSGYALVPANGTLLRDPASGRIYVVAGGAPLQMATCGFAPGGDCSTAVAVDAVTIETLNHLAAVPADGTLLHDAASGDIYIVAGGAPLRLGSCTYTLGGFCGTAVTIDGYAIAALNHLRAFPEDGTVLRNGRNGARYVVAGGAPLRLADCSYTPGGFCATAVTIDGYAIEALNHLRARPANGTVLHDASTGQLFMVEAGRLDLLGTCARTQGGYCATSVTVDNMPITGLVRRHG